MRRRSQACDGGGGAAALLLPLALLPLLASAFLPTAPSWSRRHGRIAMSAGDAESNLSQDNGGTDRQGFLKGLGITASAAILGPALLQGQAPLAPPPAARAVGALPDFEADARFAQHLVLNVPDMAAAIDFYTTGLNFRVLRSRVVNGANSTFVGYGPETLQPDKLEFYPGVSSLNEYGAHFSIELNEVPRNKDGDVPLLDPGSAVAYLQLAVPSLRISKLLEAGGQIRSAYGWVLVDAPNGLTHQVIVGNRRDPSMMLALNVPDLKKAAAFYKDVLGMKEQPYPLSRAPESIYEPKQPKGSVYLAYNPDGFGVLLLPYTPPKGLPKTVRPGGVVDKLAIATDNVLDQVTPDNRLGGPAGPVVKFAGEAPGIGTRVAVTEDPNGVGVVLVEYADLERELGPEPGSKAAGAGAGAGAAPKKAGARQ